MGFTDPISLTDSATTAFSFPRIGLADGLGQYRTADGLNTLSVSHQYKARNRHSVPDRRKVAADPFATGLNNEYSLSIYTVFDVPRVGFTSAEIALAYSLINNFFDLSSAANVARVAQGEI